MSKRTKYWFILWKKKRLLYYTYNSDIPRVILLLFTLFFYSKGDGGCVQKSLANDHFPWAPGDAEDIEAAEALLEAEECLLDAEECLCSFVLPVGSITLNYIYVYYVLIGLRFLFDYSMYIYM